MQALISLLFFTSYIGSGFAETVSPLDPSQHPISPKHEPIFSDKMVPLDAKLSWTERFNGDETFNTQQVLMQEDITVSTVSQQSAKKESMAMSGMSMDARGVVKGLRLEQGKIKISHGEIDKYGMPAMTMMFKVEDPSSLDSLKKGQHIGFDIDNSSGGFVITHIMPIMEMEKKSSMKNHKVMDARGEVKTVKASQGKIKIKHGPIDKYGMPAMTMVFKVSNPSSLEGLKKGQRIGFDIDNSSGGFVITHIMPTGESSGDEQTIAMDTQVEVETAKASQGNWFVQLIAFRSLERAEEFWQKARQSIPALKEKSPRYQNSGDVVRVLIGPGQSNQAANLFCQKLKQDGQDCFIRSIK